VRNGGETRSLRDFDNCFRALFYLCAALEKYQMMIAEFGTGEFQFENFDKAAWITATLKK
jgi:hypothetical protein